MRAAFVHPDLGIGGAERLVVDAAVGLQQQGHDVTMITSHCDRTHCFEEIKDNTLQVEVYGDFLPVKLFNRFAILCSILRQLYLTLRLIVSGELSRYDIFVVDQLSFCIPLLHLFKKDDAKVLFYCHHPDLLAAEHGSLLRRLYRAPFDFAEELTTGYADNIVVNSKYTKGVFKNTFKTLAHLDPAVVYPCVPVTVNFDQTLLDDVAGFFGKNRYFLSVNRFDKPKNIELAVRLFKQFVDSNAVDDVKLVIAGGFDPRNWKNVQYLIELEDLCKKLGLVAFTFRGKLVQMPRNTQVLFMPSVSSHVKDALIRSTSLLLYTPLFEHFGIVPLEAMRLNRPVLAVNYGGPLESVVEGVTGFLRPPDLGEWAKVMEQVSENPTAVYEEGLQVVKTKFSRESMTEQLLGAIESCPVKHFRYDDVWLLLLKRGVPFVVLYVVGTQYVGK